MKNLFKKIGALLVAAVMVLSMCTAVFAEGQETPVASTASLTVQGLVLGEKTTVEVYKVVGWNAETSQWVLGTGVTATDVNLNTNPVGITWANFVNKRSSLNKVKSADNVTNGSVTFNGLDIGAYYVYAHSENTTYNPMGEAVYAYDETTGLMKPADKIIDAKGSTYTLTKAFTGKDGETTYQVVERGQEVPFTITATFPSYDKDAKDRAFQITDEPTGMKVTEVTVKVGETKLTEGTDYTLVSVGTDGKDGSVITKLPAEENQKVRVSFSSEYIGLENKHAGQTVTVEVKAQITDADAFANTASSDKGSNTPEVNGKLGSITINKYDENYGKANVTSKLLAGAEFSIAPNGGEEIKFVYVGKKEGVSVYKKATPEEIADTNTTKVTNIVAEDGVVVAKGLDDGVYQIVEKKAPAGYSVVDVDNATIANGNNPAVTVNVSDTKLHSLPHTGGMGTYLFTIIGVVVMAGAAGAFFISRRKGSEE